MGRFKDLTGMKFNRLTVLTLHHKQKRPHGSKVYWECKCDCGNTVIVCGDNLKNGHTKSCGCYFRDAVTTHGLTTQKSGRPKIYSVWAVMKDRCTNPNNKKYHLYGAKGISVCDDWQTFERFYQWAIDNGYKEGLTIDRIDSNGDYCPENCRWVDYITQNNNLCSNTHLTFQGRTQTAAEWCRELDLDYHIVICRISSYGWTVDRALTTPTSKGFVGTDTHKKRLAAFGVDV